MKLIKFGDVFRYNEKEYIFLKRTSDITYAAYILNDIDGRRLLAFCNKMHKKRADIEGHTLFAFVTLSTEEFKDRHASFTKTGADGIKMIGIELTGISISERDIKKIRAFIKSSPCIPPKLKEGFK